MGHAVGRGRGGASRSGVIGAGSTMGSPNRRARCARGRAAGRTGRAPRTRWGSRGSVSRVAFVSSPRRLRAWDRQDGRAPRAAQGRTVRKRASTWAANTVSPLRRNRAAPSGILHAAAAVGQVEPSPRVRERVTRLRSAPLATRASAARLGRPSADGPHWPADCADERTAGTRCELLEWAHVVAEHRDDAAAEARTHDVQLLGREARVAATWCGASHVPK